MFVKRVINTRRNYLAIIPQLLIPIIFTLLAIVVTLTLPQAASADSLVISLNSYKESFIPFLYKNCELQNIKTLVKTVIHEEEYKI